MTEVAQQTSTDKTAIRPFLLNVPEAELVDLRRRINATKWPERETIRDASQGVQLATVQALARYWGTEYDWRKCEAKLKALPHFINEIDGLDIHFIHVRSKHENALPLIVTHGWPGSVIEQMKIIDPRPGYSTTTPPVRRSWHASSTESPRALRAMTSSTTSLSTG
jgi:Epoxide hydrolase N terminus